MFSFSKLSLIMLIILVPSAPQLYNCVKYNYKCSFPFRHTTRCEQEKKKKKGIYSITEDYFSLYSIYLLFFSLGLSKIPVKSMFSTNRSLGT